MKKKIPLAVLEIIKNFAYESKVLIKAYEDGSSVLHFRELDGDYQFYFKIKSIIVRNQKTFYLVEYCPFNKDNFENTGAQVSAEQLKSSFAIWLRLIKEYKESKLYFLDPVIEFYDKELAKDFALTDENANFEPFDLERQLWLGEYLDRIVNVIEDRKTDDNIEEVTEIVVDVGKLKQAISRNTKAQVVVWLRIILAKIWKLGLDVVREIFIDTASEIVKKLFIG